MLRTLENILGYRILARDGEVGRVYDFFLDDSRWRLRYVVAETGSWLSRRRVLISLAALGEIDADRREFQVNLTSEQVKTSPGIDTDQPVSRREERLMNTHYGWPAYWPPEALMGPGPALDRPQDGDRSEGDVHLRSFREVGSYALWDAAGPVGKLADFVIDDTDWSVKQPVVAVDSWRVSRYTTLSVGHITGISWADRRVTVDLAGESLEHRPDFAYSYPANREEVIVYFDYCGRPAEPPSRDGRD